jgi:hypothetical protein
MDRVGGTGYGIIAKIPLIGKSIGGFILEDDGTGSVKFIVPRIGKTGNGNRLVFVAGISGKQQEKEHKPVALSLHLFGKYQDFVFENLDDTSFDIEENRGFSFVHDFNLSLSQNGNHRSMIVHDLERTVDPGKLDQVNVIARKEHIFR